MPRDVRFGNPDIPMTTQAWRTILIRIINRLWITVVHMPGTRFNFSL
jgi:hypothetical protein